MFERIKQAVKKRKFGTFLLHLKRKIFQTPSFLRPPYYCFPSTYIHINDHLTQERWSFLNRGYDEEEFLKHSIQKIRSYSMATYDALINLAAIVKYCEEKPIRGNFLETGVCSGGSASMMAIACLKWGKAPRKFHLFDSFEGLPEPSLEKDFENWMQSDWKIAPENCKGKLVSTGALVGKKADAEHALFHIASYPRFLTTFHVGWFQDTVPKYVQEFGKEPIALLHLDGDLYESTLIALRHLYPLLVPGGFVVIDDWGLKGCRGACEEFFRENNMKPFIHYVDGVVRYFVKE